MKVAEYRSLVDGLSDAFASARSAATEAEREGECNMVVRCIKEVEAAGCPRASQYDRERAARLCRDAGQYTFAALMAIHDNQRAEAAV